MKSLFIILALVGMLIQNFSKLIIYIDFELNRDYIAKNLCVKKEEPDNCCKGSCHLQKQLEAAEKEEQAPANPTKEKNEVQLFSEVNSIPLLFDNSTVNEINTIYLISVSEVPDKSIFHPPKVQFPLSIKIYKTLP